MKRFLLATTLLVGSPAMATTIQLPYGSATTVIDGPYQPDGTSIFLPVTLSITAPEPTSPDPTEINGYEIIVSIGTGQPSYLFDQCNSTAPGPCGMGWNLITPFINTDARTLRSFVGLIPFGNYADPNFANDLIVTVELPDGFFVAGGVPETSTWVMLLFGFAGLAWAGMRKRSASRFSQSA